MKVKVKTNKKHSKIVSYDTKTNTYVVELKSKPLDFKANLELLRFLSKTLNKKLILISGHRSKIKILKEL